MTTNVNRPFNLWLETFPGGETARLLIWRRDRDVQAALFRNRRLQSERSFDTLNEAENWGRTLLESLKRDSVVDASIQPGLDQHAPCRPDMTGITH